jgi:hypothetical protein
MTRSSLPGAGRRRSVSTRPSPGDDEEDAARFGVVAAELALGDPVAPELLSDALLGLGRAVPLDETLDHGTRRRL